jgi:hypothetical protein
MPENNEPPPIFEDNDPQPTFEDSDVAIIAARLASEFIQVTQFENGKPTPSGGRQIGVIVICPVCKSRRVRRNYILLSGGFSRWKCLQCDHRWRERDNLCNEDQVWIVACPNDSTPVPTRPNTIFSHLAWDWRWGTAACIAFFLLGAACAWFLQRPAATKGAVAVAAGEGVRGVPQSRAVLILESPAQPTTTRPPMSHFAKPTEGQERTFAVKDDILP